jgi:hypothetical protein
MKPTLIVVVLFIAITLMASGQSAPTHDQTMAALSSELGDVLGRGKMIVAIENDIITHCAVNQCESAETKKLNTKLKAKLKTFATANQGLLRDVTKAWDEKIITDAEGHSFLDSGGNMMKEILEKLDQISAMAE